MLGQTQNQRTRKTVRLSNEEKVTMSENLDIRKLADARRAAAKHAGVSEDVANKALDAICDAGADSENAFDLWDAIDEQIGKAQAPGLQEQLIELRTHFEEEMFLAEISRLDTAFNKGPDAGWKEWLTTLAETIVRFRLPFSQSLCAHLFPFSESNTQALENLRKAVRCMFQSRWPETYEQVDYLTKLDFLPAVTRARLCVIAGKSNFIIL